MPDDPKLILPSIPCSFVLIKCKNNSNTWNKLFRPCPTSKVSTSFNVLSEEDELDAVDDVVLSEFNCTTKWGGFWAVCTITKFLCCCEGVEVSLEVSTSFAVGKFEDFVEAKSFAKNESFSRLLKNLGLICFSQHLAIWLQLK